MSWHPEMVAYAGKKWLEGRSATEITRDLRDSFGLIKTRNAVIGVLHRNGYSSKGRAVPSRPVRAPKVARSYVRPPKPGQQNKAGSIFGKTTTLNAAETEAKRQKAKAEGDALIAAVRAGAKVESPNARPWMERGFGECKFPLGERGEILSCCNPVSRGGYCEGHAAVCFDASWKPKLANGSNAYSRSSIEGRASWFTRFDGVEQTAPRKRPAKPSTIWDEARAA